MNIGSEISRSIKEGKWLDITYKQGEETTKFWASILDIADLKKRTFKVSIFNDHKSYNTMLTTLYFDKIISAKVIEFSSCKVRDELIQRIEKNISLYGWLNYDKFNHNILNYYNECNYLDNDPFQKEYCMIPGIDVSELRKKKFYHLNEEQAKVVINNIYHYDIDNKDKSNYSLAISVVSIDQDKKKYILCYYDLFFDPYKLTLRVSTQLRFNKSFLIEGRKHSLFNYVNMNVDDFIDDFVEKYHEKREILMANLKRGEVLNERPDIFLIEREFTVDLTDTFEAIENNYLDNNLNVPLKSFFGNISKSNNVRRKEPSIVIYDNRININQMRVIYNATKYPVTYVQGPPGTGKTQTILNVILSSFFDDKTVLVCSSNNKPVDGIIEKLKFKYYNKEVLFPFLRLGKYSDVISATLKIKELYEFKTDLVVKENLINKIKINAKNNNAELIKLLDIQERRILLEDYIESSNRLLSELTNSNSAVCDNLKTRVKELTNELNGLPIIKNEEVTKLFTPVKESKELIQYLYFKSLDYINKLHQPKYKDLIEICYIEDDEERASMFNKWTQNPNNMKMLNMVFPIIFSTNISTHRLGGTDFMFDLVVMDEAGQCNVAHALIPISKAKSLLLVGDPNQLKPVVVLEKSVNDLLMEKYHVGLDYDYKENSILDVMIRHDNISKYILLKYHYRCGRKIINFSNQRYYNNDLILSAIDFDGELGFIDCKNTKSGERNSAYEEAYGIVEYLKRNNAKNVSIITPFVNQQVLINRLLKENNIEDINCGTIHSLQGAEKETVILSTAISPKTSKNTYNWIRNNYELINVAITRAQKKLIIAGDIESINALSDKKDDLYNLVQYVHSNGEVTVPKSELVNIQIGKSNGSKNEAEFFKTISQFCSVHSHYDVGKNVSLSKLFKDDMSLNNSTLEFDFVIYEVKMFNKKPVIAIELNGGEHFGNYRREYNDSVKREICQKKGIKLLTIPNSFIKSYEYIKDLIIGSKNKKAMQLSLFDEEEL